MEGRLNCGVQQSCGKFFNTLTIEEGGLVRCTNETIKLKI